MITREQAEAAVLVTAMYLAQQEAKSYPPPGLDPDELDWNEDPQHWDDAKDWAKRLLQAANRDGHHGCLLCRS